MNQEQKKGLIQQGLQIKKLASSDVYDFLFGTAKDCSNPDRLIDPGALKVKATQLNNIADQLIDVRSKLTKEDVKKGISDELQTQVGSILKEAQKEAKSNYLAYFIIFLALAIGFIIWTLVISGRVTADNPTYGIREANIYIIYAVSLVWYAIVYIILTLWLVKKRLCKKGSLYVSMGVVILFAIYAIWSAFSLVGIMQTTGKDCVECKDDPKKDKCKTSEGEKDSAQLIFILTLVASVVVLAGTIYWIYGLKGRSNKPQQEVVINKQQEKTQQEKTQQEKKELDMYN